MYMIVTKNFSTCWSSWLSVPPSSRRPHINKPARLSLHWWQSAFICWILTIIINFIFTIMMMTNLCPARLSSHWWQNIASKSRSRLSCFLIIVIYQSLWITNKINAFVLEHVCYNVNSQWAVTKQKKDKPNIEFQHISPSDWRDEDDGEPLIDILSDWRLACQLRVSWLTTHQVQRLDSALPLTPSHLHLQCTHPDAFNLSSNLGRTILSFITTWDSPNQ